MSSMEEAFGNVKEEGVVLVSSLPPNLVVKASVSGNREISVETVTSAGENMEKAVQSYNKFLEKVTGYSSKERKKMMNK